VICPVRVKRARTECVFTTVMLHGQPRPDLLLQTLGAWSTATPAVPR